MINVDEFRTEAGAKALCAVRAVVLARRKAVNRARYLRRYARHKR